MTESPAARPATVAPSLADRLRGAIWGQFVGDAFCLGTHWIYDLDELTARYPDGIRGFEPPLPGHYHALKQPGQATHYGEAALVLLECVAARGSLDVADFGRRFVETFGATDYSGYRDNAIRGTLENFQRFTEEHPGDAYDFQNGAADAEPATVSRLAPVIIAHRDLPETALLELVKRYTKVTQNEPLAITFAQADALVFRSLLDGAGVRESFVRAGEGIYLIYPKAGKKVHDYIATAVTSATRSVHYATTELFGQACPLESSFPAAVHCALRHCDSFPEAMRENARAGGDNAGRATMIGGWLGACLGVGAIPAEWRARLHARDRIEAAVEKLIVGAA